MSLLGIVPLRQHFQLGLCFGFLVDISLLIDEMSGHEKQFLHES